MAMQSFHQEKFREWAIFGAPMLVPVVPFSKIESLQGCFYPSLDALENIYHYYPTATIIMSVRERRSWLKSAKVYNGLVDRWERLCCPDFPRVGATDEEWLNF
jgi:hypothetical protein